MTMIENGKGGGRYAEVNEKYQLAVDAVTRSNVHEAADDGSAWSIPLDATAPSGATFFFLFKNDGEKTYAIHRIRINSSAAGVFRFVRVTGTPSGGTTVVPTNMNLGVTKPQDTLTIQTGASITGLTELSLLLPQYLVANTPLEINLEADIIVPPGTAFALKAPGAATVNGTVLFYED